MADIIKFPGESGSDSGGPGEPMLEERVARLEEDVREIRNTVSRLEPQLAEIKAHLLNCATKSEIGDLKDSLSAVERDSTISFATVRQDMSSGFASIREDLAYLKGRSENMPTTWQLIVTMISVWAGGAAVVFAASRFFQ